jgi:hypothetical protein
MATARPPAVVHDISASSGRNHFITRSLALTNDGGDKLRRQAAEAAAWAEPHEQPPSVAMIAIT